jgi:hypothetical protein
MRDYARFVNNEQLIAANNSFTDITWGICQLVNMIVADVTRRNLNKTDDKQRQDTITHKSMAMECTEVPSPLKAEASGRKSKRRNGAQDRNYAQLKRKLESEVHKVARSRAICTCSVHEACT